MTGLHLAAEITISNVRFVTFRNGTVVQAIQETYSGKTDIEIKHADNSYSDAWFYKKIEISESQIGSIIDLLIHDKKNSHGKINFILLKEIAEPVYDIQVKKELIKESFKYYLSWVSTSINISKQRSCNHFFI